MSNRVSKYVAAGLWFAGVIVSFAAQAATMSAVPPSDRVFAPVGPATRAPIGWSYFCNAQPKECAGSQITPVRVQLDASSWAELGTINRLANRAIVPISDEQHYGISRLGIVNWWTYPDDGSGNCNDYVLLKRKLLVEAGWPRSALLMTVVRDRADEGHLVLMVRTDRGDVILDNMRNDIVRWNETGYRFVKRQSDIDHNLWVSIDSAADMAGVQMRIDVSPSVSSR